jgi:hypothetical protein
MDTSGPSPLATTFRWISIVHGLLLLGSALGVGVVGFLILSFLGKIAREQGEAGVAVPRLVEGLVSQPALAVLLAVPVALCAALVVIVRRHRWVWFALSMACLVAAVGLLLFCFLSLIAPLYSVP